MKLRPRLLLLAAIVLGACSAGPSAVPDSPTAGAASVTPTAPPSAAESAGPSVAGSPTPTLEPSPVVFTSPLYGYTVTLPTGWDSIPATTPWNGVSESGHEETDVDQLVEPSGPTAWAFAGPVKLKLKAFVADQIAALDRDHGDTCPKNPEVNTPIRIAGSPGRFLAWNCGILINMALVVHGGIGYQFAMRDVGVQAATDPNDRAILDQLLSSLQLPS